MSLLIPLSIAWLVGIGIYNGLVSGIGNVTMTTCGVVKKIYTHKNPDVTKILYHLDLERRLMLVQSVLNMTNQERNIESDLPLPEVSPRISGQVLDSTKRSLVPVEPKSRITEMIDLMNGEVKDPIELCLIFLRQTIHDIHDILTKIDAKIEAHKRKWLPNWRNLNIKEMLEILESHSQQLDARFEDLTKIATFLSNRRIANMGL